MLYGVCEFDRCCAVVQNLQPLYLVVNSALYSYLFKFIRFRKSFCRLSVSSCTVPDQVRKKIHLTKDRSPPIKYHEETSEHLTVPPLSRLGHM